MLDPTEIEEACERAAVMHAKAARSGSSFPAMTYEDGLREALDWVCENADEDPTQPE